MGRMLTVTVTAPVPGGGAFTWGSDRSVTHPCSSIGIVKVKGEFDRYHILAKLEVLAGPCPKWAMQGTHTYIYIVIYV